MALFVGRLPLCGGMQKFYVRSLTFYILLNAFIAKVAQYVHDLNAHRESKYSEFETKGRIAFVDERK